MKTIEVRVSDQIVCQLEALVKQGWFGSRKEIIDQALQRFLDSHNPELMEKFIREDVEWGLHGN
jgi:Arc/MetJ-type ribon-helix-helix transcriptional regulator